MHVHRRTPRVSRASASFTYLARGSTAGPVRPSPFSPPLDVHFACGFPPSRRCQKPPAACCNRARQKRRTARPTSYHSHLRHTATPRHTWGHRRLRPTANPGAFLWPASTCRQPPPPHPSSLWLGGACRDAGRGLLLLFIFFTSPPWAGGAATSGVPPARATAVGASAAWLLPGMVLSQSSERPSRAVAIPQKSTKTSISGCHQFSFLAASLRAVWNSKLKSDG